MEPTAAKSSNFLDRIRKAAAAWSAQPLPHRLEHLRKLRRAAVDRMPEILAAVQRDAAKVRAEALLTDLLPSLECLLSNEKNASRVLSPQKRPGSLLFPGTRAEVRHEPWGGVLIVVPWNNPFQLSLLPAATALAAGNAVILKPSEKSPGVAGMLRILFAAAGFPESLVTIVEGWLEVVRELVAAGSDLVFFTGGVQGGKAVYEQAADRMTPVVMELGGKDAMIVFADADLDRVSQAAVYGAFAHDGRHCVSIERLYVERGILADFVSAVVAGASGLRRSPGPDADLTPESGPDAFLRLQERIEDALGRGAQRFSRPAASASTMS